MKLPEPSGHQERFVIELLEEQAGYDFGEAKGDDALLGFYEQRACQPGFETHVHVIFSKGYEYIPARPFESFQRGVYIYEYEQNPSTFDLAPE